MFARLDQYDGATLTQCTFTGNSAGRLQNWGRGGAVHATLLGEPMAGRLIFFDCEFVSNVALESGGAIFNDSGAPLFLGCSFTSNNALGCGGEGGGAMASGGNPSVADSTFTANTAVCGSGGAINIHSDAETGVTVNNSTFIANTSGASDERIGGGAIFAQVRNLILTDCTFENNSIPEGSGGAVNADTSRLDIDGCTFRNNRARSGGGLRGSPAEGGEIVRSTWEGNSAEQGGAVYLDWSGDVVLLAKSTFRGNSAREGGALYSRASASLVNCIFADNVARPGQGGAVQAEAADLRLTNCTVADNHTPSQADGAGIYNSDARVTITNTVLLANIGGNEVRSESEQLFTVSGTSSVAYSCVEGWTGALGGDGNIGEDPLLLDLHPLPDSPCINGGSNYAPALPIDDLDENARVQNCRVDMGAYESSHWPISAGDCNGNESRDDCDVYYDSSDDCNENHVPDECDPGASLDCNGNRVLDECDIARGDASDDNINTIPDACEARGDFNGDGEVSLIDYATLFACLNGPSVDIGDGCFEEDLSGDSAVDLIDVAFLFNQVGQPPP